MKIGLLISKSIIYPEINFDFMNGLRLATGNNKNLEFIIEGIDFGAKDSIIVDKAQKLLFEHQLHGIVALGGRVVTSTLSGVALASQIPVIIADTGGDIYTSIENQWVFHNSLEIWKSALLMGDYIRRKGHKKTGLISSFYDSGYGMLHAFTEGLASDQVFTHIAPYDFVQNEIKEFSDCIKTYQPDALFGILSHEYASRFLTYYSDTKFEKDCTLYSTSTLAAEKILEKVDRDISITSITSWSESFEKKESKEFAANYLERSYKKANLFSLLGYECGKALSLAASSLTSENPSPKMLSDALREVEFEGPRSTFNFKGDRQNHTPKHWLEEINYKDKKYTSDIIEEVDITSSQEAKLFKKTKELENSGWFNPYLCI